MRPRYKFRIAMLAFVAGWITGLAPAAPAEAAAPGSAEVTKLLSEASKQAYAISVDATLLQSYTRSNLDWSTHAKQINRMKNRINAALKTVSALDGSRGPGGAVADRGDRQDSPVHAGNGREHHQRH